MHSPLVRSLCGSNRFHLIHRTRWSGLESNDDPKKHAQHESMYLGMAFQALIISARNSDQNNSPLGRKLTGRRQINTKQTMRSNSTAQNQSKAKSSKDRGGLSRWALRSQRKCRDHLRLTNRYMTQWKNRYADRYSHQWLEEQNQTKQDSTRKDTRRKSKLIITALTLTRDIDTDTDTQTSKPLTDIRSKYKDHTRLDDCSRDRRMRTDKRIAKRMKKDALESDVKPKYPAVKVFPPGMHASIHSVTWLLFHPLIPHTCSLYASLGWKEKREINISRADSKLDIDCRMCTLRTQKSGTRTTNEPNDNW